MAVLFVQTLEVATHNSQDCLRRSTHRISSERHTTVLRLLKNQLRRKRLRRLGPLALFPIVMIATACFPVHVPAGQSIGSHGQQFAADAPPPANTQMLYPTINSGDGVTPNPIAAFGVGMTNDQMKKVFDDSAGQPNRTIRVDVTACYPSVPAGYYPRVLYDTLGNAIASDGNAGCMYASTVGITYDGGASFHTWNLAEFAIIPGETVKVKVQIYARGTTGDYFAVVAPAGGYDVNIYAGANSNSNGTGTNYQTW